MRANELMIGDWVYSTFCDKPCKVIGIEQYESEYANVKVTNVTGAKDINSIYFIPLTAEILEKNGFPLDVEETNHPLYKGTEIKENIISMPPNEYKEHLIWNGEYYIMFDSPKVRIDYVHQFQHTLRLCGIDKEIVL